MSQPEVRIFEYDTAEIADPSGTRHIPGGSFAFKQRVSLGCMTADPANPGTTSGTIVFEGLKFEIVNGVAPDNDASKVTALTIGVGGIGSGISDLKLYLAEDTGLTIPANSVGQDPAFLQFAVSGTWQPNPVWPSGITDRLTTTIPTNPNVFRQDGANVLISNDDQNASQFIYLNLVVPWGFPLGEYGVCGSGLVRLGLLFNFYNNDYLLQFGSP